MNRHAGDAAVEAAFCVVQAIGREDCPVSWMKAQLPAAAVSVLEALPAQRQRVLGWLSCPSVCIYFTPAVVWRTPGVKEDDWWAGLPGRYIDLRRERWNLSHWMPLP